MTECHALGAATGRGRASGVAAGGGECRLASKKAHVAVR